MSARKITRLTLSVVLLAAAAAGTTLAIKHLRPAKRGVPTIRVARGNLDLKIYTSGELRAGKSAMMVAPSVGSSLHLIFLAKTGTHVKPGELVIDFDPSDQEHNLEMASSDLKEAEQSIAKAKADASVQESQDKVDLLKAEFDVRRAEMDVSKKDLVSAIDAKKNLLALDEARRRLSQLKEDIPSHAASNQADIAVAEEKLAKARLSMELAQKNIQNMHVRAPIDGLVAVQENRQTMFYFTGMRLPEYREGDEVQPGSFVAQILDVEQMELQGKVAEIDRANLSPGEPAEIEIYAFPQQKISGKVKDVAGSALQNTFFGDSGSSKFGVVIGLDHPDPQLRPGLSGEVAISAGEMKDVLYLPPQAIFTKNGNPVAFVRKGNDFVPQKIKITRRSETRIAVEGVAEGTEVSLVDPELETSKTSAPAASSSALGGGPLMSASATTLPPPVGVAARSALYWLRYLPEFRQGLETLLLHKLRTFLTMLGMIFGVAAVVSMLSIGAGAQQQVMAFIEQLGVRNLIIEAKESSDWQAKQKIRQISPGLTFQDLRAVRTNTAGIEASTARKRFTPSKMIPKSQHDMPVIYGVAPIYQQIVNLRVVAGRFFDTEEDARASAVCVLGQGAGANLFGQQDPVGKYVKVNEQWFHVIGVVGPQLSAQTPLAGLPEQDLNNLIYVPLYAAVLRLEDTYSDVHDEIDGIYLHLDARTDSFLTAEVVRSILNVSHHNAGDFSVIVPSELLAEQRNTQRIFEVVMVAIAAISLLVGGIGIMNIMLAGILERTHEIGVRRAVGARQSDISRQFLVEALLISFVGGVTGIFFGFGISRLIAWLAGWSTIITLTSILLAFLVSAGVGLVFGIYPAMKAARLDPVEALRYE